MRIKVKRFEEITCRHHTIGSYLVQESSIIDDLKKLVSLSISTPANFFHFESYICEQKVILTESFPFNFFFTTENAVIFIEIHHFSIRHSRIQAYQEAVFAINQGNEALLRQIFALSKSIEEDFKTQQQMNGWGLLHYASFSNQSEIIKLLQKYNWNVNEETEDNWTPLMLASAHGHEKCVNELLKCKSIQINKLTKRGSALHLAVTYGHFKVVLILLNAKACCNLEDLNGKIPLELATDKEIVELIPKFQGTWEIEKYENKAKPPPFAGVVNVYQSLRFYDKPVFLFINIENGFIEEFASKEDFIEKRPPMFSIKIIEITEVVPIKSRNIFFKSVHYFRIYFFKVSRYYYVRHKEFRDEFILKINEAIHYCQLNKIGQNQSHRNEFEVIERDTLKLNQSFVDDDNVGLEHFERVSEIGSGSFGIVYKVIKKDTGVVYAMKSLSKFFLNKKRMLSYAISETKIMKQLVHPFILGLSYSFQTNSSLYLVLEYCEGGDLENLLDKEKLSEQEAKFYICEIILGLEYLHSLGIIYRDLKPANILLDAEGHIRLADFGLAKSFDDREESISTVVGSPAYISPEIICHEKLTKAADIYSLGIVMHELLTGKIPFPDLQIDKLFYSIRNGKFLISESLNKDAKDLIRKILNRKPEKRLNFEEIKNHEFFNNIDWNNFANKRYKSPRKHDNS